MRYPMIASALFVLAGCASTTPSSSPLHATATIEAGRFHTGAWPEIGRRPMWFVDGRVARRDRPLAP